MGQSTPSSACPGRSYYETSRRRSSVESPRTDERMCSTKSWKACQGGRRRRAGTGRSSIHTKSRRRPFRYPELCVFPCSCLPFHHGERKVQRRKKKRREKRKKN